MDKEPITKEGLTKLKNELTYLKEKKDQRLLHQYLKQDRTVTLKRMQNIMQRKNNNHIMKAEFKKLKIL